MADRALPEIGAAAHARGRRRPPPARPRLSFDELWHNVGARSLLYQVLIVIVVLGTATWMVANAQHALANRGVATGFGFLGREAGFPISQSLIPYAPSDSFLRAFIVAVLNTLSVSIVAVVGATVLGVLIGMARLSSNLIVARLASIYVELFRNTPQLVQISFWYLLVTRLPPPRQAFTIDGIAFLSNRGLSLAVPTDLASGWVILAALVGAFAAWLFMRYAAALRRMSGRRLPVLPIALCLLVGCPALVLALADAPVELDRPVLQGFNFRGGVTLAPEFIALFLGLSLYIAAFIAEIVRSGVQSVGRGQVEAARSIGLRPADLYRYVVLPQALRVIVPPAASQYVSLFKNSSLGVVIGYPELFNISNTVTTLTGHAIECVLIMAGIYLFISLGIAAVMNLYNRAVQLKER